MLFLSFYGEVKTVIIIQNIAICIVKHCRMSSIFLSRLRSDPSDKSDVDTCLPLSPLSGLNDVQINVSFYCCY